MKQLNVMAHSSRSLQSNASSSCCSATRNNDELYLTTIEDIIKSYLNRDYDEYLIEPTKVQDVVNSHWDTMKLQLFETTFEYSHMIAGDCRPAAHTLLVKGTRKMYGSLKYNGGILAPCVERGLLKILQDITQSENCKAMRKLWAEYKSEKWMVR